jgi:hypothetical protein
MNLIAGRRGLATSQLSNQKKPEILIALQEKDCSKRMMIFKRKKKKEAKILQQAAAQSHHCRTKRDGIMKRKKMCFANFIFFLFTLRDLFRFLFAGTLCSNTKLLSFFSFFLLKIIL